MANVPHIHLIPHRTSYDPEYNRLDIAPKVMGIGDYDGLIGYVLFATLIAGNNFLAIVEETEEDDRLKYQLRFVRPENLRVL